MEITEQTETLAFLGMGHMGTAICSVLVKSGRLQRKLLVWNRTESKADAFIASVSNQAEKVELTNVIPRVDIVWSCLTSAEAVSQTFDTLLAEDLSGKTIIDSSSIQGSVSNQLGERVRAKGGRFVSMPLFGDPSVATEGNLICVAAGSEYALAQFRPYIEGTVAKAIIELVDRQPGDASTIKLIGNTLLLNSMNTIAEALVFAEKSGVGSDAMGELIGALFPTPPQSIYLRKMLSGEYHLGSPAVPVPMATHLANVVLGLAEQYGVSLPAYEIAVKHLREVKKHHEGDQKDITSMYGAIRVASGLSFKDIAQEGSA